MEHEHRLQVNKGSGGTSVSQHCVWTFACLGMCELLGNDILVESPFYAYRRAGDSLPVTGSVWLHGVPIEDQANHWLPWEVFAFPL